MATVEDKAGYAADFCPPLEEKHRCPVCGHALRDPMQTTCGHRFCTICIKQIVKQLYPECPIDKEKLSKDGMFPDNFCKREVMSLLVRCNNRQAGCDWMATLKELASHEVKCDYALICCSNEGCQVSLLRKQMATHKENDCKYRLVECQICGDSIIFCEQRAHFQTDCPDMLVDCDNGCGAKVKRREMYHHITEDCQKAVMPCRYTLVGCSFKGNRLEIEHHESNTLQDHMTLLLQQLGASTAGEPLSYSELQQLEHKHDVTSATRSDKTVVRSSTRASVDQLQSHATALIARNQSLISELDASNERLKECTKAIEEQREQIGNLWTLIKQLQVSIQQMSSEIAGYHREITSNGAKLSACEQKHITTQSKMTTIEHRQLGIERSLSVKDGVLAEHDVRLLSLEMTDYCGVLRWKITEVARRRDEAVSGNRLSVYSPPFFTSRSGYKMCARVYLNGDGLGKGSHLSLFFVIMRGEFDALLPWPFRQAVTFTLIDQEGHRHIRDTFRPELSSSSFQRPTSEMNVASGCPLFVRLDEMASPRFIKDDTLFIRVSVDTVGLVHP